MGTGFWDGILGREILEINPMKMKYKLYSLKDDDVGKCYITSIE
jgi:hypothetical protein